MANKVKFGLKNLYVAFRDLESSEAQPVWKTPVPLTGAVGLKPKPEGSQAKFFADNSLFFGSSSNDGYTIDLEVALIPIDIQSEMLGYPIDDNGALVEHIDAVPGRFALMGQVEGDAKARRFVYYDCEAARPSSEEKTKSDKLEPTTETIPLVNYPVEIADLTLVRSVLPMTDENSGVGGAYTDFFTDVYLPVITPAV